MTRIGREMPIDLGFLAAELRVCFAMTVGEHVYEVRLSGDRVIETALSQASIRGFGRQRAVGFEQQMAERGNSAFAGVCAPEEHGC